MEEIQRLQRRVDEQLLERAEADPQWRQQLLEDPEKAMGSIPEARRLQEILPEAPTLPIAAREEYFQLSRSLTEKILDRAASDPLWKQRLLDEPEAALREADFPEARRLEGLLAEEAEVRGQDYRVVGGPYDPVPSGVDISVDPNCGWTGGGWSYHGFWKPQRWITHHF